MDRNKLLNDMMLEDGDRPVEMVKPKKKGILDLIMGKEDSAQEAPEMQYPEPYKVDQQLRKEGFQVPVEKRLFFERIARMLGK